MREVVLTLTGNGASIQNSTPCIMDWRASPFNVTLVVKSSGSTTTMTGQWSPDDPANFVSTTDYNANATWINISAIAAKTATTDTSFTEVCRAIRLQAGATGTDVIKLYILQAGSAL